jgi:hypothetical protein
MHGRLRAAAVDPCTLKPFYASRAVLTQPLFRRPTDLHKHFSKLPPTNYNAIIIITMADVRSMLRQQRAARQQAQKPSKPSATPAAAPTSKKRKADAEEVEERKRTRTEAEAGVPAGFFDAGAEDAEEETVEPPATMQDDASTAHAPMTELSTPKAAPLDATAEAELDAFMNEMAKEPPPKPAASYTAGAFIEAKPMTAAEISAQAREDQSAQRARKDEEMEGEKEDAARALEDEFDEMEDLEGRVKRLREQREALRTKSGQVADVEAIAPTAPTEEDDMSESDDEDWDDWRFRPA